MYLLQQLRIPILALLSVAAIVTVQVAINGFGRFINVWFPCETDPTQSIDCYVKYDLNILAFLALVAFAAVILIAMRLIGYAIGKRRLAKARSTKNG